MGVVLGGILAITAAAIGMYGAFKRRVDLMLPAMTAMMVFLGIQQSFGRGPRWLAYLSFGTAAMGLVSTIIRRVRGERPLW